VPARATQAEPKPASPEPEERQPRSGTVASLQQTIGNRAVGSLLRQRVLARDLQSQGKTGGLIKSDKGEVYEIIRSDFSKVLKEWKHTVTGADGKTTTIWGEDKGYSFSSATQIIEDAIAAKKTIKTTVDSLPEAHVNKLGDFHAWLDKVAPQMTDYQFAYLAAGIMVNSRHAPAARKEALRLISAELGDKDVAMRMIKKPVLVVVVPRDKQMTELTEFASLKTSDSGGGPGKTFDGREWAHVRGVGNVVVGSKVYAAVTEENILGGDPDPKVFEEKKDASGAVVTPAGAAQGGYTVGYSTTTHEFAHVLHRNGLSDADKQVIADAYAKRRTETSGSSFKLTRQWVDGPRVNPSAPKNWKDAGWTDAKYLKYLKGLTDAQRKPYECYAAQNDAEYFAQLSNAYLGTNMGNDPTTGRARNNGRAWIKRHEPKEIVALLDRLYQHKTVNDITKGGKLTKGGKCANPPKPAPPPPAAPPGGA
jgi:hypothetical protein